MHRLKSAVQTLAAAMGHTLAASAGESIDETLVDFDLSDDSVVPAWVTEMLDAWAQGLPSDDWVSFVVEGMEASDSLEFIRCLHEWLPATVVNEGERWTLTAAALAHDAVITFEGSAYLIKVTDGLEPGEVASDR